MKLYSVLLLFLPAILVSCSTSQNENQALVPATKQLDKKAMLSGEKMKEWEIEKYILNGKNVIPSMDKCLTDNLDIYFADHRFESVEGSTKCEEDAPFITDTGHWHFNEDSTEIEVSTPHDFYILKLIEITTEKFHYFSCNHQDTVEAILRPKSI